MDLPTSLSPSPAPWEQEQEEPGRLLSARVFRVVCGSVKWWWRLTTDKAYLGSWLSRRPFFKTMLGVSLPINFFLNVIFWSCGSGPAHGFLGTPIIALMWLATKRIPIDCMWTDLMLGCGLTLVMLSLLSADSLRRPCGYSLLPPAVFWMFSIGMHSSAVATTAALLIVSYFAIDDMRGGVDRPWVVQSACWGAFACAVIVPFEMNIAQVFHMNQEQLVVRRRILEEGSSGFLVLDAATGRIASASSGVAELLGPNVLGRQLVEFLQVRDRATAHGLYQSETPGRQMLCTFASAPAAGYEGAEFDAYLLAYHVDGEGCHMTVRVVGEARAYEDSQPTQGAEGRELAERAWVSAARSRLAGRGAASSAPSNRAVAGRAT